MTKCPVSGTPLASASALAYETAIRTPVNEPGPDADGDPVEVAHGEAAFAEQGGDPAEARFEGIGPVRAGFD